METRVVETLDSLRGVWEVWMKDVTWREWFTAVTSESVTYQDIVIARNDLEVCGYEQEHTDGMEFLWTFKSIPTDHDVREKVVYYVNLAKELMEESTDLDDKPIH